MSPLAPAQTSASLNSLKLQNPGNTGFSKEILRKSTTKKVAAVIFKNKLKQYDA